MSASTPASPSTPSSPPPGSGSPAPTTDPLLARIGQVAIIVHDVARAVAFYRDVLGLKFLFQAGDLAFFDCGGTRLMLGLPETKELASPQASPEAHPSSGTGVAGASKLDHPGSILYYVVADIQAAYETIKARGAAFDGDPHIVHRTPQYELWLAFLRDPEGNMLALMHEKGTL